MKLVLIGIQGSGKGTQAGILSSKYGIKHINVGEIFRNNIKNETEIGKKIKEYVNNGKLVPDEIVIQMVKEVLDENENFILDGFPRNINQAEFLVSNYHIDKVVNLLLPDEISKKRLLARRVCENCKADYNLIYKPPKKEGICDICGGKLIRRKDDTEEAVQIRLDAFHKETSPVIDFF
jgi:adenylate kinase